MWTSEELRKTKEAHRPTLYPAARNLAALQKGSKGRLEQEKRLCKSERLLPMYGLTKSRIVVLAHRPDGERRWSDQL